MKKRPRNIWTPKKVAWRISHGYGQGELGCYIPWIGIRDLSSKGTSTRMYSFKTGRKMQFLSNIERDTFLIAEFREDFVDYWEQWPLERHLTQWAAQKLGVRHPIYVGSTLPVVMTVDGVLTLRTPDGPVRKAIDCKHSDGLNNERTNEKLAVARLALSRLGMPHLLVTERNTQPQVVQNILWVRIAVRKRGELEPFAGAFDQWPMRMHKHLMQSQSLDEFAGMALHSYCAWFDSKHQLPTGWGLRFMKLLMWQHLVEFDLRCPIAARLPLRELQLRPAFGTQPDSISEAAS